MAFCVAFAGFLRVSEFTWDIWAERSHLTNLSRASVQFMAHNNVLLHLPASKTDQFRRGIMIPLSSVHDSTCPVAALRRLIQRYPKLRTDPLFSRSLGSFNQTWVIHRLRTLLLAAGINPVAFSGHSFRRGAANTAVTAGISRAGIMKMERWKSDAVDRYFSSSVNTANLFALSKQLHSRSGLQLLHNNPSFMLSIIFITLEYGIGVEDWGLSSGECARSLAQL